MSENFYITTFCRPATVFLSLLALDIASHWFQIYRYCLSTGSVDLFFLLKLVIVPYINYVLQFFYIIILCLWNWKYFFVFIVDIDCEDIITMPVFHFFFFLKSCLYPAGFSQIYSEQNWEFLNFSRIPFFEEQDLSFSGYRT